MNSEQTQKNLPILISGLLHSFKIQVQSKGYVFDLELLSIKQKKKMGSLPFLSSKELFQELNPFYVFFFFRLSSLKGSFPLFNKDLEEFSHFLYHYL